MNTMDTTALLGRMREWPRVVRLALMLVPMGALFGAIWLVRQDGLWTKVLGVLVVGVAMPSMVYSKRALGLCVSGEGVVRSVERRYMREMAPALTVYMMIVLVVMPLAKHDRSVPLRVVMALSPVVPIAFMVRAMVRYVMGSDELEQRTHLQALAVSAGVVGMASITAGFLAATGVIKLGGEVLLWVFPALLIIYGLTRIWVARRYRGE